MGATTAISWTDHTFNPWWGCSRVSPGCQNCYAETFAKRTGHDVWGKASERRFFGAKHWIEPIRWNLDAQKAGRPVLVFCASMADVFEDRSDLTEPREQLFELIDSTPSLEWQLLTKRPENVLRLTADHYGDCNLPWWQGVTVEDQARADERIPLLLEIPARVRFLSCEPLLGPVRLRPEWLVPVATVCSRSPASRERPAEVSSALRGMGGRLGWRGVDWIIVGGESGPGHRPLDLDHARSLRRQAEIAGVPFFFKQVGGRTPTAGGDLLDGEVLKAFPPEAKR